MKFLRLSILAIAGVVAAATAGLAQNPSGVPIVEAEQAAGRQIFKDHCAACHVGTPLFGPPLNGVVGRKAGSVASFRLYSDALKNSGLVWTEDNLRKWLSDTTGTIANTAMPHATISDPAEQLYVIAYLKTLKAAPPAR
jgi:cytochrome c